MHSVQVTRWIFTINIPKSCASMAHTGPTPRSNFVLISCDRYPLYQFVITDGMGHGQSVFYALVRDERTSTLITLFEVFLRAMGEHAVDLIKTVISDKMKSQIKAAHVVFKCDVLLCKFHISQAINRRVICSFFYSSASQTDNQTAFLCNVKHPERA